MTRAFGRWMEDLTIQAQGGSGVQPFAMLCATALQAINGILLAELIGLRRKRGVLAVAALLCLYPAFLDYYSFVADQLSFVLGDHFAILGILAFVRSRAGLVRIGVTAFLFLLSIACHQPRIALVSFLAAGAALLTLGGKSEKTPASVSPDRQAIGDGIALLVAIVIALVAYWVSSKVVIDRGPGNYLSTPREALQQVAISYEKFFTFFTRDLPGLPARLQFLPVLGVAIGALAMLWRAWQRGWRTALIAISVLVLMPIALRATYVINCKSPEAVGRLVFANGYCLAFFIGCGLRVERIRAFSAGVGITLLYFFFILATQESNFAAYKTTYELSMIQRIAARAETLIKPMAVPNPTALVVVGFYPPLKREPYVRHPGDASWARIPRVSFTDLRNRQASILNFFQGSPRFRNPTKDEVTRAIESTKGKAPWPSDEAVYLFEDILVVFLEPYRRGTPVTIALQAHVKVPKNPPSPGVPPKAP